MNKGFAPVLLVIVLAIAGIVGVVYLKESGKVENLVPPTQKACTLEAKLCPDGSSVGRTGPNCEFSECPGIEDWKTYSNSDYKYTIQYPSDWKTEINCQGGSPGSKIVCLETPDFEANAASQTLRGGIIYIYGSNDGDGSVGIGFTKQQFCGANGTEKAKKCIDLVINGKEAVKRSSDEFPFKDIGFLKNGKINFSIRADGGGFGNTDFWDTFGNILNTIKFSD